MLRPKEMATLLTDSHSVIADDYLSLMAMLRECCLQLGAGG